MAQTAAKSITINVGKWQAVLGVLLTLVALATTAWGVTSWAIRYQVAAAVDARVKSELEEVARTKDVDNARELLKVRLDVLDSRQKETGERVEFIWRRELERSRP